eukprot:TRINITY_DN8846_c0_g1_i1.p1 TRINITY_DN8846_c0_g1~~TRINITY_DN8846_c0_g1_i1.p1  ORF type:complete len:508 (+),score=131.02 TRINITY_DN8846_c0_g1_i1:105-1526(+)
MAQMQQAQMTYNPLQPTSAWAAQPTYTNVKFEITKPKPLQPSTAAAFKPTPTKPVAAKQGAKATNTKDWPPRLKKFVERAFEEVQKNGLAEDKAQMEKDLKEVITLCISKDNLWTINWDDETIPSIRQKMGLPVNTKPQPPPIETPPPPESKPKSSKRKGEFGIQEDEAKKMKRNNRFSTTLYKAPSGRRAVGNFSGATSHNTSSSNTFGEELSELDWDKLTVQGFCQDLEKPYLRLTSAPDPATVRPEPVLKKTVTMLRDTYKAHHDYEYVCEQLKSVRQDLTVQRIKNKFTVDVYELHARTALENGDLGEYNQCQTQLKELYKEGLPGNVSEFTAYRLLYFLCIDTVGDLAKALTEIPSSMRKTQAVDHAMLVISALSANNYNKLFKLFPDTPNMGHFFMERIVERTRKTAIKTITKAYRPTIELEFVQKQLGFETKPDCKKYLASIGTVFTPGKPNEIDTKSSLTAYADL